MRFVKFNNAKWEIPILTVPYGTRKLIDRLAVAPERLFYYQNFVFEAILYPYKLYRHSKKVHFVFKTEDGLELIVTPMAAQKLFEYVAKGIIKTEGCGYEGLWTFDKRNDTFTVIPYYVKEM